MGILEMIFGEEKPMSQKEILPDGSINPFHVEKMNYARTWVVTKKHKADLDDEKRAGDPECKHEFWSHDEWYRMTNTKTNKVLGLFYCKACMRAEHKEVSKMSLLEHSDDGDK